MIQFHVEENETYLNWKSTQPGQPATKGFPRVPETPICNMNQNKGHKTGDKTRLLNLGFGPDF